MLLRRRLPQHQSQHLPGAPAEATGLRGWLQRLQDLLPPCLLHVGRGGATGNLGNLSALSSGRTDKTRKARPHTGALEEVMVRREGRERRLAALS